MPSWEIQQRILIILSLVGIGLIINAFWLIWTIPQVKENN